MAPNKTCHALSPIASNKHHLRSATHRNTSNVNVMLNISSAAAGVGANLIATRLSAIRVGASLDNVAIPNRKTHLSDEAG